MRVIALLGAEIPEWKNDLRHWLIVLNIVAVAFLIYFLIKSILSPRSQRQDGDKSPANLTPFLPDEDLEGRRLERVQGWALIFAAVVAVSGSEDDERWLGAENIEEGKGAAFTLPSSLSVVTHAMGRGVTNPARIG